MGKKRRSLICSRDDFLKLLLGDVLRFVCLSHLLKPFYEDPHRIAGALEQVLVDHSHLQEAGFGVISFDGKVLLNEELLAYGNSTKQYYVAKLSLNFTKAS